MLLIALAIGGVVLTVSDKPLLWVGRRAQAVRNRLARQPSRRSPACPNGSCASAT